ncbi:hypothetical protein DID76_02095 [Candidatus Marinamargulisbacteria bacterium SCGC AG-414-C22]|nr:hypothetical protein DID76_02095 [Candidatus Marinamargulisbacteria bacterium SCGC AG-414-C22]
MIHSLLMAGGKGTRLWPLSRQSMPKQFLSLLEDQSLIESTLKRCHLFTDHNNIWICGNQDDETHLAKLTHLVKKAHILQEPFGKNTAACIGWSLFEILKEDPAATLVIVPSDAWISNDEAFKSCVMTAVKEAEASDCMVTIGIKPTKPHTGYGYIETVPSHNKVLSVSEFKEKPNQSLANQFFNQDNYFWNAGIFVVKGTYLARLFKTYLPEHYNVLSELVKNGNDITTSYEGLTNISIDYGILEKIAPHIRLVPATFEWNDIGSLSALTHCLNKDTHNNYSNKNVIALNATENIVKSDKKVIALADVDNLIIVDTPDALVILPKDSDQKIKDIYDQLDSSLI